jgi:hypothetical protein
MRGKQDFGVLVAQDIMAVIVGKGVNRCHWLKIVVQVFGLS